MKKLYRVVLWATIVTLGAFLFVGVRTFAADSDGAGLFKSKCAICHGADGGAGTPMGKMMKVPDLRSAEVQKLSDAELAGVIANGKNKMPPFKGKLSEAQIHSLVTYVRELAKK